MYTKYISPLTDWGFKKLFGEESSKNNLIHFLNAVFHEQGLPWIESLELKNNEHLGYSDLDRSAVFDLYCKGKNGERFIIELQKVKQKHFLERSLFYSTFMIQDSAEKGFWNFKIAPVYVVCILDFQLDDAPVFQDSATLIFQQRQQEMVPHYRFFFLECPKIILSLDQDSSKKDKWLFIFKYLESLKEAPDYLTEPEFENFLELASFYKLKPFDRAEYNASRRYRWEFRGVEDENIEKGRLRGIEEGLQKGLEKGIEEGLQKGLEKGLEKGIEEGLQKGLEKGIEEGKINLIQNMLKKGLSVEDIAKLTDFEPKYIQQIKNSLI